MSSPAGTATPTYPQWHPQHPHEQWVAHPIYAQPTPLFGSQDMSLNALQQQLMQMQFQVQQQAQQIMGLQEHAVQQEVRKDRVRWASAARPHRRERQALKRGAHRSCGSDETICLARDSDVLEFSSNEEHTMQGRKSTDNEDSVLRLVGKLLEESDAKVKAAQDEAKRSRASVEEAAAVTANARISQQRAEAIAQDASAKADCFQQQMEATAGESSELRAELKSAQEALAKTKSSIKECRELASMQAEDLHARIIALHMDRDKAQTDSDAKIKTAQEESMAARARTVEAHFELEVARAQRDSAEADRDSERAANEAIAEALSHAQASVVEALADTATARISQQRAEGMAQDASAKADFLQQRIEALIQECTCAISHSMLQDPVVTLDGHTYEREAIQRWFTNSDTSPLTGMHLPRRDVLPNRLVAKLTRALRRSTVDDTPSETSSSANPQEERMAAHGELWCAARQGDRVACLELLGRGVPDINFKSEERVSVLSHRRDAHTWPWGLYTQLTVLHLAALQGWADVCSAILAAPGFTEMGACAHSTLNSSWVPAKDFGGNKSEELTRVLGSSAFPHIEFIMLDT